MRALIVAPEGAAQGLAALCDNDLRWADFFESTIAGDSRLSALERVEIYANMYFYRLLDSLKEDYPGVLAVAGEVEFHNLITDYLLAHPPAHFSLRYAGSHLPEFLRAHRLARSRPFLPALAELERAILDAFDAPDASPLEPSALEAIPPAQWPEIRFLPSPSLRLLALDWNLEEVWEQVQRGEAAGAAAPGPCWVRVWRQEFRVFHRSVAGVELAGLQHLLAGHSLGAWCEEAAELAGGEAEAAAGVLAVLRQWLADGILVGVA